MCSPFRPFSRAAGGPSRSGGTPAVTGTQPLAGAPRRAARSTLGGPGEVAGELVVADAGERPDAVLVGRAADLAGEAEALELGDLRLRVQAHGVVLRETGDELPDPVADLVGEM